MANVLHKDITGADLHEPLGADTATKGQVYYADGAGSGAWIVVLPVGTLLDYLGSTAPTGFLFADGKTIGDASSGGTARANADTNTLFTLLWNSFENTQLPIQDSSGVASTRGASAAADFAAHKRMPLPDVRERAVVGWDNLNTATRLTGLTGSINANTLGTTGGTETHTLVTAELASHAHAQQGSVTSGTGTAHSHGVGTLAVSSLTVTITNGTDIVRSFVEQKDSYSTSGGGNQNAVEDVQWNSSTLGAALASGALTGTSASESSHTHSVTLSGNTATAGSGSAHNNVMPCFTCAKIIFYGN